VALIAGVDTSTQATKVEIRDADTGALVAHGRAPHPIVTPPVSEQHPRDWWDAFEGAWSAAGSPDVAAISVAAQQHGCVVLDAAFEPLRPAKLWNDVTTAPDAAWLLDQLPAGAAGWAQAAGNVPVAALTISKLSWLHRSEPDTWSRLAHVCLPHDWMTMRLTGRLATDRGDASGTGYWSPTEERYRFDLLEIVDRDRDWSGAVPEVLGPIDAVGTWQGAVVGPGTGDNMAAALGLGLEPGDVAVSIGTSGTVFAVSDTPAADPRGEVAGFADATGRYLPLVCTLNATRVTDAVAGLVGRSIEELDRLAAEEAPGAGGLVLLPYLDGERTPDRPEATGTLAGIRSDVSAGQVARAAYEGVVCGLLDGLDALARHARVDDGALWLVGGGSRSSTYRQVLADLSRRPVTTRDDVESVALGAAVQAAATLAGEEPAAVHRAWADAGSFGTTATVEPRVDGDVAETIRGRYAARRELEA
jgi:xylulokinase